MLFVLDVSLSEKLLSRHLLFMRVTHLYISSNDAQCRPPDVALVLMLLSVHNKQEFSYFDV